MNKLTTIAAISTLLIMGCSNPYISTDIPKPKPTIKFYSDGDPNTKTPDCITFVGGGSDSNEKMFHIRTGGFNSDGYPSPRCQIALSIINYGEKYIVVDGKLLELQDTFYYDLINEGYLGSYLSDEDEAFIINQSLNNDSIVVGSQVIDTSDFDEFYRVD
ncbi:hypothetical protein QTO02_05960 [Vibrio fortis]